MDTQTINNKPSVTINQRVAILIDGNNIEMGLHTLLNSRHYMINFDKLVSGLLRGRSLSRLMYFREGQHISNKLRDRLNDKYFGTVVPCQKSADVPLTIEAVQMCEKVDVVIIGSGDADYVTLIKFLKMKGLRVEVAAVASSLSPSVRDCADYVYYVDKKDTWKNQPTISAGYTKEHANTIVNELNIDI